MKTLQLKTVLVALFAVLTLMTSCKKDNDLPLAEKIVGVWTIEGGDILVTNHDDINDLYDIETVGTMTLHEDGTGKDDFTLKTENRNETLTESYTWTLEGNTLNILSNGTTFSWQVEEVKKGFDIFQEGPMPGREDLTMRATLWMRK